MRTIIYVDGYNLFYGVLSKSRHKWLDLNLLFDKYLLRTNSPRAEIVCIKYFTAPALSTMSSDPGVEKRQAHYHRALKTLKNIEIIKGYHQRGKTTGYPVEPIPDAPHIEKLKVYVMEEKQSDVNIGLQMYRDAIKRHCDQVVLCSNDADLAPALSLIKNDCPHIQIGLILPRNNDNKRKSGKLVKLANWCRPTIKTSELEDCQFADRLIDKNNRTILKPEEWE